MKTTNFNALKRKWICILFLVLFMAGGTSLIGMSTNDMNAIDKVRIDRTQSNDEHEEKIKFIKVEKIKPVPYLKKLLIF